MEPFKKIEKIDLSRFDEKQTGRRKFSNLKPSPGKMFLYHGGVEEVTSPNVEHNKNAVVDFGSGFYLNTSYQKASRFAHSRFAQKKKGVAFVNIFEIDKDFVTKLDRDKVLMHQYRDTAWLKTIYQFRPLNPFEQISEYDVIYGPIADGEDVFGTLNFYQKLPNFLDYFNKHSMSIVNALRGVDHGFQYTFKTQRAADMLTFVECDYADKHSLKSRKVEGLGGYKLWMKHFLDWTVQNIAINENINQWEAIDKFIISKTYETLADPECIMSGYPLPTSIFMYESEKRFDGDCFRYYEFDERIPFENVSTNMDIPVRTFINLLEYYGESKNLDVREVYMMFETTHLSKRNMTLMQHIKEMCHDTDWNEWDYHYQVEYVDNEIKNK